MSLRWRLRAVVALAAVGGYTQPALAEAKPAPASAPVVARAVARPNAADLAAAKAKIARASPLSLAQKIALLQQAVKYVFVIFQENESFDHFFGTFPRANGLFSAEPGATPANKTPSFSQTYLDTDLNQTTIAPFLMPQAVVTAAKTVQPIYPYDMVSVDHGHQGMANDLDVVDGKARNDRYAMNQEGLTTDSRGALVTNKGAPPSAISLAAKQKAEAAIGHIDCDTIPFMWSWAKNFVLLDNFHQTIVGPSTPNAIAMIAGQSGQTQWARHPEQGPVTTYANPMFQNVRGASYAANNPAVAGNTDAYVPIVSDPPPFPGSSLDPSPVKPPFISKRRDPANPAPNQTYASLPLSFMGSNIKAIIQNDQNPSADLRDVQDDITEIANVDAPVNWGWYEQGYNNADVGGISGYVLHHNGPQYFGYIGDNTQEQGNLHSAAELLTAITNQSLPSSGVFYLRGGYTNNDGLAPIDPTPAIKAAFSGNDDHPAYADQQISEEFAAKAINAIASSPYWVQSAIIIAYDETDGFYDHDQITQRNNFADGSILAAGPRVPAIVISPWANTGMISRRYSEHSSIIKFINELFNLEPLASLPDEKAGKQQGLMRLHQGNLGPADGPDTEMGDLTEAFNYPAIANNTPLPASLATFTPSQLSTLPHLAVGTPSNPTAFSPNGYTNGACAAIGVLPTDFPSWQAYREGAPVDPYPQDVNPRPTQSPGMPTSGSWTP